jgi:trimeric autotransporter adhesin
MGNMNAACAALGSCLLAAMVLVGCSNGRGSVGEPAPAEGGEPTLYSVSGTVTGLAGSGLVLRNNGSDDVAVTADGGFTFPTRLASGAAYAVTVGTHPTSPSQTCSVANGNGSIAAMNVVNITVTCRASEGPGGGVTVGGSVSGLVGSGLMLELNELDELPIASNGTFTFANPLESGTSYGVTISAQPTNPTQQCTIANATGTVGSTNVTNVRVTCAADTFSVGGTVTGLLGSGLVLQNNGGDSLAIDASGAFTFAEALASDADYHVSVLTQPFDPIQACTVTRARGTIAASNVTDVLVSCMTSDYTIGGTMRDLEGSRLVLRNNGGDDLTINTNGPFAFDTALPTGASYNITIAEQPRDPRQTCSVSNGSGAVSDRNVTNVSVRCSSEGYRVGGHVSELRGSGLVLQNNGGDDLAIGSNGRFNFPTPLHSGAPYNVTVRTQPSNPQQTCAVVNSSGVIFNSNIRNVEVECEGDDDDD